MYFSTQKISKIIFYLVLSILTILILYLRLTILKLLEGSHSQKRQVPGFFMTTILEEIFYTYILINQFKENICNKILVAKHPATWHACIRARHLVFQSLKIFHFHEYLFPLFSFSFVVSKCCDGAKDLFSKITGELHKNLINLTSMTVLLDS